MAGQFDFNPNDVTVGLPVYEKGSYELEIGEPKSFYRKGKEIDGKAKDDNYGVFYKCKIATGAHAGKPFLQNCYMHVPEAAGFAKSFLMAALGFKKDPDSEMKFNQKYENENWKFNPEDKSAGDMWHKVKNQRVIVDLDVVIDKNDITLKTQKVVGFRPIGS